MVHPKQFVGALAHAGVTFFTGVPDSLLKDFLAYVEAEVPGERHITAANEGGAIGIAAGYHLASGKVPAVYMQNSGLGNAVNPLTSLADKEVYAIPLVLIVGWRGEPGVKDEPQHVKQGRITTALLDTLEIPYAVIEPSMDAQAGAGGRCVSVGVFGARPPPPPAPPRTLSAVRRPSQWSSAAFPWATSSSVRPARVRASCTSRASAAVRGPKTTF